MKQLWLVYVTIIAIAWDSESTILYIIIGLATIIIIIII